jgi:hypothetical protein
MESAAAGRSAAAAAADLVAEAVALAGSCPGGDVDNTSAVVMLFN